MGGILLFAAALAAFGIGAGSVLLYVAYRRTDRHAAALINAHARIAHLERQLAALTFGEALPALPAQQAAPQTAIEEAVAQAALAEPQTEQAAPIAAAIAVETPTPPPPVVEPVVPIGPHVPPVRVSPPLAPQFPPRTVAPEPQPAPAGPVARESRPFQFDAFVAVAALISAAALLSVRLGLAPPLVGVAIAALAGAGLLLLAEHRRHTGAYADWIALFGLAAIALALGVGRTSETAAPPLAYMLGAGALGLCAVVLSLWYGRMLFAFGLALGLAAPVFALAPPDAPYGLAAAFVIAAAALLRARPMREPIWAWVSFTGALCWGALAAARGGDAVHLASAAAFGAAMFAAAIVYGWEEANTVLTRVWRRESVFTSHAAMAGALAAVLAVVITGGPLAAIGAIGLLAIALVIGCAAIARPGFTPAALAVAAVSALAIGFWPASGAFDWRATGAAALAIGAIFLFCGAAITMRGVWLGAALAALAPVALLVAAQARMAAELSPGLWALTAGGFALACGALYASARSQHAHAGSFVVTGAALALVCAIGFLAPAPWPPAIVAFALPALAALNSRWPEAGLRAASVLLAVFLALQLATLSLSDASSAARAVVYITAAGSAYAASRIYAADQPRSLSGELIFACALLALIAALSGEGRRAFAMAPADQHLFEAGYQTCLWIGLALTLAHRLGPAPRWPLRVFEGSVFAASAAIAILTGAVLLNPWWGAQPAAATGLPGFNALLAAYLAPAILFAAYALLRAQQGWAVRAAIAAALSAALALANAMLEIRRAFHGPEMAGRIVTANEGLAFGIATAALLVAIAGAAYIYRRAALPPAPTPAKTVRQAAPAASRAAASRAPQQAVPKSAPVS